MFCDKTALGTEYYAVTYSDEVDEDLSTTTRADVWAQIGVVAVQNATKVSLALPTDRNISVTYKV